MCDRALRIQCLLLQGGEGTSVMALLNPGEASSQQEAALAGGRNGLPSPSREEQKEEGGDRWVWMKKFGGIQEV